MRQLLSLVVFAFALAGACEAQKVQNVGTRPTPDVWVPVPALEVFTEWWSKNLKCIGEIPSLRLPDRVDIPRHYTELAGIKWFVAGDDDTFVNPSGKENIMGQFFPPDTIVLAGLNLTDEWTVRHEMLHAMGWAGHPMVPFRWPCDVE
jgi:hypothetical protein